MNKYGVEHFHIELIEETDIPEEREFIGLKNIVLLKMVIMLLWVEMVKNILIMI